MIKNKEIQEFKGTLEELKKEIEILQQMYGKDADAEAIILNIQLDLKQ